MTEDPKINPETKLLIPAEPKDGELLSEELDEVCGGKNEINRGPNG